LLELLNRITRKDEAAMAEFYARTQPFLQVYVGRRIRDFGKAEEVVQDVYWHVWLNVLDFQPQRGGPSNWLYMIARSRTVDALRRAQRDGLLQALDDSPAQQIGQDAALGETKLWKQLHVGRYVQALPASHRELILLAYFDGYYHSEIASERGLPLGTVKSRLRRALEMMREGLNSADRQPASVTVVQPAAV